MEANAGMDVLAVRKKYPNLQILDGIPKSRIAFGKKEIDKILKPIAEVLNIGGYIPSGDHLIPPEVSWDNFKYYRNKLNYLIDNLGK